MIPFNDDASPRILYIASSNLRDPLIVSQVVRYLQSLSPLGFVFDLITFEQGAIAPGLRAEWCAELEEQGIHWHPVQSYRAPRIAQSSLRIVRGYRDAARIVRTRHIAAVHARSFVPGRIGLRLKRRFGVPLLYDMPGFWALEKLAKGSIKSARLMNAVRRMEDQVYRGADRLISLTDAGAALLRDRGITVPMDVIPTCVDTRLFTPRTEPKPVNSPLRLISVGSLGPGYRADAVFAFFQAARKHWPNAELQLLTSTSPELLASAADPYGLQLANFDIRSVPPEQVPAYLQQADVGLCFVDPSEAKIASCPTKMGEYLACGLPVVANGLVGDVAPFLRHTRTGVVLESFTDSGHAQAASDLAELLRDPLLSQRCRETAKVELSLERGTELYRSAYLALLEQTSKVA